jgi:FKBP-type peptidyl-prolyl cis-trans isomerase
VNEVAYRIIGNNNTSLYDGSYEEYSIRQQQDQIKKLKVDILEGEGEGATVPTGSRVLVHYTGRL